MKVKELIKELKKENPDREVHLSSDIEGNNIHTIYQVGFYQDGDFEKTEGDDYDKQMFAINGKKMKWVDKEDYLVIYPTDTTVNSN